MDDWRRVVIQIIADLFAATGFAAAAFIGRAIGFHPLTLIPFLFGSVLMLCFVVRDFFLLRNL